ncbi:MAG TPA: di-heme oxidoredictase family protein, partial [Blastocatellia bacterium]
GVGGVAGISLNGALQFDFGGSPDKGITKTETGVSLDDPDKDGIINELTEGDIDAAEFYMLHAPSPAVRATKRSELGRTILNQIGCTRCHVEDWKIEARDEIKGFAGDRRLFDLATRSLIDKDGVPQVVGSLVCLYDRLPSGQYRPKYGAFVVRRIYSDFKQWDIGAGFHELRFDGSLQREHRTTPLWGAGSTAPYGHSGQYLTLDDVIRAHAGAATRERNAYLALSQRARHSLLEYLESLALYPTDEIASDISGDGAMSDEFKVAGQRVGYERFDARFLFANHPHYKYLYDAKNANGRVVPLTLIENVDELYGLSLQYRRDGDGDGFPDILRLFPSNKVGKKE